jgi:hypothetical protein
MNQAQIQGQALFMAGVIELIVALGSALMVVNWRRAARGTRDRNAYVGIRLPRPLRSREAWVAANRVAYRSAPLYVLLNVATCAGLLAAAEHWGRLAVAFIGGGGFVALFILMSCTAFFANRAANAVDVHTDPRTRTSTIAEPGVERSDSAKRLTGRRMTTLRWVSAIAACGLTVFLLGTIIDGYVLALHHQLQPSDNFGVRDDTALSCWPRWYAAQKAFFNWLLLGCGPVLVGASAIYVGAAVKRRPPQDIWVLIPGTVFVLLPFAIAAVIHADSVARAIAC